jgi:predicted Rossmann-fold nucleotide-binding protein
LGIQNKVCGLLNVNGYYDPMIAMADKAVTEGFIRDPHREWLLSDTDVSRLLDQLNHAAVPGTPANGRPTARGSRAARLTASLPPLD